MKLLLLAEKPSVSRAIEEVYKQNRSSFAHVIDFGSFHGHLMGLKEPAEYDPKWESWKKENLPILPGKMEYKEIDTASCRRILDRIKTGGYDGIVNACDAGQEGELIFWSFYVTEKINLPVYRYWASSNAKGAILNALKDLKPSKEFENLKKAAFLRAEMDWKIGMNLSRAATLTFNKTAAVGRVKTPVLKIISDREKEIRNFKEEVFYEVNAVLKKGNEEFEAGLIILPEKETRMKDKTEASRRKSALTDKAVVKAVKTEEKESMAPVLMSTADLQKEANKAFKFSADKTLAIAQDLYEAGYITYPRTNARYLPKALVPEIPAYVKALENHPEYGKWAKRIDGARITATLSTKSYVDDGKIEDHHAIITTDEAADLSKLTKDQRLIYDLVARRFLAIFFKPFKAQQVSALLTSGGENLKAVGTAVLQPGWTLILGEKKEKYLPTLSKGDVCDILSSDIKEGKTQPPKRYTPSTILAAMENAGNFVDDKEQKRALRAAEGIGTSATRAGILKELVDKNYLSLEKNVYYPSEATMKMVDAFGERDFVSPVLTARMQQQLVRIQDGENIDLSSEIDEFVKKEIEEIYTINVDLSGERYPVVGVCPCCGKSVRSKKSFFVCDSYKDSCNFILPKTVLGAEISDKDAEAVLSGKPSREKSLQGKNGKFKAKLILAKNENGYGYGFQKEDSAVGNCPCCGKKVLIGPNGYFCEGKLGDNPTCDFSIAKTILKADISTKDMKSLLKGKGVLKVFTYKNGSQGMATLSLEKGKPKFNF